MRIEDLTQKQGTSFIDLPVQCLAQNSSQKCVQQI